MEERVRMRILLCPCVVCVLLHDSLFRIVPDRNTKLKDLIVTVWQISICIFKIVLTSM